MCDFIENLWRRARGEKEDWSWLEPTNVSSYERLLETEWDEGFWYSLECYRPMNNLRKFKAYAQNRMVMGAMRYGTIASGNWKDYDHERNWDARIGRAMEGLNLECFVDAYNIAYLHYLTTGLDRAKEMACEAISLYNLFKGDSEWLFAAEDDGEHCEKM